MSYKKFKTKMTKRIILSFSLFLLIGCTSKNKSAHNQTETNKIVNKSSSDIDAKFETFIEHFSRDSLFQISRIDFPLKVKELDEDDEKEITVNKSEFRKLDFNKNNVNSKGTDEYKLNIKVNGDEAVIETRGIDNGIYIDTYFKKKNGKWKLVTSVDSST